MTINLIEYYIVKMDFRRGKLDFRRNLAINQHKAKVKKNDNKQQKRKIIGYNPTYSANIKTNIGKTFPNLIKKHFPKTNKLHKIFNLNTLKISYSRISNISSFIWGHNKNLLNPIVTQQDCNCQTREDCPLQNQCKYYLNIIYRADVHCGANGDYKLCFGIAQTPFKGRFRNHSINFNHKQYIKSTELYKYIWPLRDAGTRYTNNWSIIAKVKGSTKINYYPLVHTEKYHLKEYFNDIRLLNKNSEFINACRYQSRLLLKKLKRNDSMD